MKVKPWVANELIDRVLCDALTRAGYDCLIFAVGRAPAVDTLGLELAGVAP